MAWAPLSGGQVAGALGLHTQASGPDQLAALDPYLLWADLSGFRGYAQLDEFATATPPCLPVLLRIDDRRLFDAMLAQGKVAVSSLYAGAPQPKFCALRVNMLQPAQVFLELREVGPYELGMAAVPLRDRQPDGAAPPAMRPMPRPGRPCSVVVGVVDDGCALFHAQWQAAAGGSRLLGLWDQGTRLTNEAVTSGHGWRPAPGGYGRDLPADDALPGLLDALRARLRADTKTNDERDWYAALGYPRARGADLPSLMHGTHVLDLAAGVPNPLPPDIGAGDASDTVLADAGIVFVQLPRLNVEDTSGGSLGFHVLDGLRHIMAVADRQQRLDGAGPPPLVVNLSYGTQAGPHDGSSLLEQAIDAMLLSRPDTAVVIGAGNARQAECHAKVVVPPGQSRTLRWVRRHADPTDSFVELWWREPHAPAGLDLVVRPPGQESAAMQPVAPGEQAAWIEGGEVVAAVFNSRATPLGQGAMALVAIGASAPRDNLPAAPAGTWTLELHNRHAAPVEVDAWLERDDTPRGSELPRGQSRWLDVPAGTITPNGTFNTIGTGRHTLVVGACRQSDGSPSPYSALGPDRRPAGDPAHRAGPDLLAPGDEAPHRPGLAAAALRSGQRVRMPGTSVAAPVVARWVATWLAGQAPGLPATAVRAGALAYLSGPQRPLRAMGPPRA